MKLSKVEKAAAKFARDLAWFKRETTPAKLEAVWREDEAGGKDFIGPVAPSMWLWQKRGAPRWPGGPMPGTINAPPAPDLFD